MRGYCGNNPMRYYDPSGYSKTPEVYNTGCPGATTNGVLVKEKTVPLMLIKNNIGCIKRCTC
jgi:hypothetical protein